MGDLLDDYQLAAAYDEMFTDRSQPREHYQSLNGVLQTLSRRDFEDRCDARDRAFRDAGITFQLSGEGRPRPRRGAPAGGSARTSRTSGALDVKVALTRLA